MTISDDLQQLFARNSSCAKKNGLTNILKLMSALQNPHERFRSVHIAGTNGKGSVSTKIAYGLRRAGYKTALFTSPHIFTYNERFQIDGKTISDEELSTWLQHLLSLCQSEQIDATFFEITTAIAFGWFADQKVDYAVVEVGLGGRLDATNIITPQVSVVTSIGYDHKEILGDSLENIAREKVGIFKSGVPAVIGPTVPIAVALQKAKALDVPLSIFSEYSADFNEENTRLAEAVLGILGHPIPLGKVRAPYRAEVISKEPLIIVDVSHNPPGFEKLFQHLQRHVGDERYHVLLGLKATKDRKACIEILQPHARSICETTDPETIRRRVHKIHTLREPMLCTGSFRTIEAAVSALHSLQLPELQLQLQPSPSAR